MILSCMPLVSRASNRRLFTSTDIGRIEPARPATHRYCTYGRGLPGECTSTWRLLNTGSARDLGNGAALDQRPNQVQERLVLGISRPSTEECADVAPVNIVVADR